MASQSKTRVRFRERAELLDFLLEVSATTSETLNLELLLENLAGIIRQVIPHELFAILLYSERRQGLRIRYALGHRPEIVRNLIVKLGEGLTGVAAATKQPVLASNVLEDARYLNALDAVRSELAVPMVARQRLVGVLDLQSTSLDAFSTQDRALLQLIAARVATAIDNARLHRRVERQSRTQRTLAAMAQEFSSILQLDALLDKIARSVKRLINYDAFIVLRVDEDANSYAAYSASASTAKRRSTLCRSARASPAPPPFRASRCWRGIRRAIRAISNRIPASAAKSPCP